MARNNDSQNQAYNLIDSGTSIKGDITTEGNIRIDGRLIGSVKAEGKVVVGESGIIEGEIFCKNADISGTLKARINVSELLTLKETAKLYGEISANKLAIEPGANFTGKCSMGTDENELHHEQEQPQPEQQEEEPHREEEFAEVKE